MKLVFNPLTGNFDYTNTGDITGTGIVGRVAEFVTDTKTLQAANLIAPANLLTLVAGAPYTLTIPETMIVSGRNVLDTHTRQIFVDGSADEIGIRNQAHSTKTTSYFTNENSSAEVVSGFDSLGRVFSYGNPAVTTNFFTGTAGNATVTGANNVGLGNRAGRSLANGANNLLIGTFSGDVMTSGGNNVGIGTSSLLATVDGSRNIAIGALALQTNVSGERSTVIGYSVATVSVGSRNVMIGHTAGGSATSASDCIYLGYNAGFRQTTLSNILIIDNQQRASAAVEITNAIIYGVMAATPAAQSLSLNAVVKTGGRRVAYVAKTADYTITTADEVIDFTANNCNATLPTAASVAGEKHDIKNSGTGVVTILTTSSQTVDGAASGAITLDQYDNLTVVSNGTNWIIT